jgi:hypothetical protein
MEYSDIPNPFGTEGALFYFFLHQKASISEDTEALVYCKQLFRFPS